MRSDESRVSKSRASSPDGRGVTPPISEPFPINPQTSASPNAGQPLAMQKRVRQTIITQQHSVQLAFFRNAGLSAELCRLADAAKKGILATSPVYLIRNAAGRRSGVISPTSRHDSRRHAGLQGDRKLHAHRVRDSSKNRHTCSRPCAISEIKSSIFSMPTEMRISASVSPISSRNSRATPESVIEAGREISVLAPPN